VSEESTNAEMKFIRRLTRERNEVWMPLLKAAEELQDYYYLKESDSQESKNMCGRIATARRMISE